MASRDLSPILAVATASASAAVAVAVAAIVAATADRKRRHHTVRSYVKRVRADRPPKFQLDEFAAMLVQLGLGFESYFRLPRNLFDEVLSDIYPRLIRAHPEQAVRA